MLYPLLTRLQLDQMTEDPQTPTQNALGQHRVMQSAESTPQAHPPPSTAGRTPLVMNRRRKLIGMLVPSSLSLIGHSNRTICSSGHTSVHSSS